MTKTLPQVGDLATQCINGDRYIVHIDRVTPNTITVSHTYEAGNGNRVPVPGAEQRTFRWDKSREAYVYAKHFTLALGVAIEHRDPSI